MSASRPEVLFLCVHNAGRSQMAAALLARHGGDRVVVHSAGSDPAEMVNPAVAAALGEWGIDISAEMPQKWTDEVIRGVDIIVTMGCGDSCPVYPGKRYIDWEVQDPVGKPIEEVRPIRNEIDRRVTGLLAEFDRGWAEDPAGR